MKRLQQIREQALMGSDSDTNPRVEITEARSRSPVLLVDETAQALEAELIIPISYTEPRSMVLVVIQINCPPL